MENKNQKQKPFSSQLIGAFAVLVIAASYLGYGLFQTASAFDDIDPNFPGGDFTISLNVGGYRTINENDPVKPNGDALRISILKSSVTVPETAWSAIAYWVGVADQDLNTWKWSPIGIKRQEIFDPNSEYYTYAWAPGYWDADRDGQQDTYPVPGLPSSQTIIVAQLLNSTDYMDALSEFGWSTSFALAEMSFKRPDQTTKWQLGETQNIAVQFAKAPSADVDLKLGIRVNGDDKATDSGFFFTSFSIAGGGTSTYFIIPWDKVGYAYGEIFPGLPSDRVQLWSRLYYSDTTYETGVASRMFEILPAPLPPPSIELTNPTGGEEWVVGETKTISWELADVEWPATVTVIPVLYFSPKGSNWYDIVLGFPAGPLGVRTNSLSDSFEWQVGYTLQSDGNWTPMSIPYGYSWDEIKVTIGVIIDGGASDRSEWFTIEDTQVNNIELKPEGPLAIRTGETVQFTASAYNQDGVLITDNPLKFIWDNATPQGTFDKTAVDRYRVTATYIDDGVITDISDSSAVVVGPAIEITSPAGGENLMLGDTQTISWQLADSLVTPPTRVFGSYVYRLKGETGSGTPFAPIWFETMYDVTELSGSFDWQVGYTYIQSNDEWNLITLPNSYDWDEVEIAVRMNEEDAHNNWGLPYGQSNWFNVNEPVVEPFFITIEHPSAGEVWYVGQNKDIEFELNRALTGPINIEFVLCQIDPGVCLDAEWLEPMIINPQDGTGPFTATWEVGTKLDGTLISNIEDFADNALISLYVTGDDVGSFGKNFNSEAFSIEESGEIPPLPLNGVYYSADIELTESIESFTSANVDWGFIDGYGLDPSGPVGGANVEVGMAFIDADGNSITLDGLNEIPQHSDSQDRDYYLIFTNATINSEYSDISRFNVATNLSEVKSVQFKVDLFTYDWNVTRPYFESLSVSYDPVTITEDPLTITVTPEDIITNPGGTFIYTILVHDNDINDELRLSDVVLAYDISEFVGDLESYELVSMDGDEYGGDTFGWELDMLVASEGLEHLNEDLTFTIDVTIDGEIVVTSVPLSLLITGQGVVSINFTTTLQMGEIESPIYRPDPQFTLYIYEVADIDRYGQVATVTVPASMISIAEDGTYSGSIATTELQPGFTYAVFAKTSQHISRRATEDITIPDSTGDDITFDLVFPELLVGDIGGSYDVFGNRDDSINSHDYSIFLGLFGNPVGEGLWSIADFNNDGSVNANDFWPFGKTGNFQEMGDLGQILGDL